MDYLPRWRAVTAEIEGASQRIQEDTARFARIVESLGLQIARAVMTLIAFIPILAGLSEKVIVPYVSAMPNSLVWLACAVSLGGMLVSWFVGAKLPMLEYNNQKAEAAFRKELVHGEDDKIRYVRISTCAHRTLHRSPPELLQTISPLRLLRSLDESL